MPSTHQIRSVLRAAVRDLSVRGLKRGAAWAAELLTGLGDTNTDFGKRKSIAPGFSNSQNTGRRSTRNRAKNPRSFDFSMNVEKPEDANEDAELDESMWPDQQSRDTDLVLVAKTFYDLGEYQRCAHALSPNGSCPDSGNQKEIFLWAYSLYLVGEKRKEEEMCEVADPLEQCQLTNQSLKQLNNELSALYEQGKADGFVLYLYGVVLKEMKSKDLATKVLCESVNSCPLNWSAWLDLASLCSEKEDLDKLTLPNHWVVDFFRGHMALEIQQNDEALEIYRDLAEMFPKSTYVLAQTALAHYNMRNFDEAQDLFEALTARDPHRLQNMDTYSNILYVKECKAELSYLAHTAVRSNKYKPETCCIVGNYYSLKGQHERAVIYFKRALRLNRRYLAAWTLMGHEFVEMKNTEAAIEAYRSAVDINPRDYRAWYGLGQTYEILLMYFYALHYYRKATTLRPYDARMWCALAGCYEKLQRIHEAIKCYKRAECHNDREGIAAQKLANLYADNGDREQAAYYFQKHLDRREQEDAMGGPDVVESLKFLASFLKESGDLVQAEKHCTKLLDYNGPEKKEAEAMLREIRSLREQQF